MDQKHYNGIIIVILVMILIFISFLIQQMTTKGGKCVLDPMRYAKSQINDSEANCGCWKGDFTMLSSTMIPDKLYLGNFTLNKSKGG